MRAVFFINKSFTIYTLIFQKDFDIINIENKGGNKK